MVKQMHIKCTTIQIKKMIARVVKNSKLNKLQHHQFIIISVQFIKKFCPILKRVASMHTKSK